MAVATLDLNVDPGMVLCGPLPEPTDLGPVNVRVALEVADRLEPVAVAAVF